MKKMNGVVTHKRSFDKREPFPDALGTVVMAIFESPCEQVLAVRLGMILDRGDDCVPRVGIWLIETLNVPTRFVRLADGKQSLMYLIADCGFLDKDECVHTGKGELCFGHLKYNTPLPISLASLQTPGVPQGTNLTGKDARSAGRCWYSALCWIMFFNRHMRELILSKIEPEAAKLIKRCLHDPHAAERLREYFWYVLGAGDKIGKPLEDEGRNGLTEAIIILAKLDIPLVRFIAPPTTAVFDAHHRAKLSILDEAITDGHGNALECRQPAANEVGVLVVRCFRTNWRPRRRMTVDSRRYYLMSAMIGSEECRHQMALSTCDEIDPTQSAVNAAGDRAEGPFEVDGSVYTKRPRIARWSASCSDRIQRGVGPMFWTIKRAAGESRHAFARRWWKAFGELPVTMFRGQTKVCDFSPHNRPNGELQCKLEKRTNDERSPGVVNTDFVYISYPAK